MQLNKRIILLGLLISLASLDARTWTDIQGRKIEADYLSQNDESVVLKLESGKEAVVPFARLSEADLAFLEERKAGEVSGKNGVPSVSPIPEDLPKRYYPMSLVELQTELAEILERPAKGNFPPEQTEALNSIQFEPTGDEVTEPGIYFVRVSGDGVDEEYLVELFDPDQQ